MAKKQNQLNDLHILEATAFLISKGYQSEMQKSLALDSVIGYKMQLSAGEIIALLVEFKNQ